ncbi:Outer membrane protein TolC precursor [Anaerohalosphaera lusitana]|uniref:Outer membrane protein TolC n=1 Tax=Anaerohalosphaera lusitana TaxID=1936003 RepID=A0A1U9NNW4_9BACT|nr:TolC family protein [Anaerohalosphaera lusitana]AQT69424.1 Outer membrane protein TolC precursor [Anaerohalosphaera lusitana]
MRGTKWYIMAILFLLIGLGTTSAQDEKAEVHVGVVIDGPWENNAGVSNLFVSEILKLTGNEFNVVFSPKHTFIADWSQESIEGGIERFLADEEIDIVMTPGIIGSHYLSTRGPLGKPGIAPFVLDAKIQSLTVTDSGTSGVKNLTYVLIGGSVSESLTDFLEVVKFKHITFLIGQPVAKAIPRLPGGLVREAEKMDLSADYLEVSESAEITLKKLKARTDAVYVNPLMNISGKELARLAEGLKERDIPSFSAIGKDGVEVGFLMSTLPESLFQRIARRTALNLQSILLGTEPSELPVRLAGREELTLNVETAEAIRLEIPWNLRLEADLIGKTERERLPKLSMERVLSEAVAKNLDIAAQERMVAAGSAQVRDALAVLLPQIDLSTQVVQVDKDRIEAAPGEAAEREYSTGFEFRQLLYSEQAWASYDIEEFLQAARLQELNEVRLDITQQAGTAYLDVLRAQTRLRVRMSDLRLTRSNLQMARERREVGVSGPGEVYRWENRLATRKQEVLNAEADLQIAMLEVNRLLHRPIDMQFAVAETSLGDDELLLNRLNFFESLSTRKAVLNFADALVKTGLARSPQIRNVKALIDAKRREQKSTENAMWQPDVAFVFDFSHRFAEEGVGERFLKASPENDTDWAAGISIDFPLYSGGSKTARIIQTTQELAELIFTLGSAREQVEQRVRAAMETATASYRNIGLSRKAEAAAAKNLDLTVDSYAQGVVSILDLLDAQNAAVQAELASANAVYDFLIDLMEVQRAASIFNILMEDEAEEIMFGQLRQAVKTDTGR